MGVQLGSIERDGRPQESFINITFPPTHRLRIKFTGHLISRHLTDRSRLYIKGMLKNPDIAPSASINRWIVSILMFHFELVHVPGIRHGPDGLSRRRPQPGDEEGPEDDFEDWIDEVNGFMHVINTMPTSSDSLINTPPITAFISNNAEEETPGL